MLANEPGLPDRKYDCTREPVEKVLGVGYLGHRYQFKTSFLFGLVKEFLFGLVKKRHIKFRNPIQYPLCLIVFFFFYNFEFYQSNLISISCFKQLFIGDTFFVLLIILISMKMNEDDKSNYHRFKSWKHKGRDQEVSLKYVIT